jgi:hypothetical protein
MRRERFLEIEVERDRDRWRERERKREREEERGRERERERERIGRTSKCNQGHLIFCRRIKGNSKKDDIFEKKK